MTSVLNHESSYESGQKPYIHNTQRGKWSSPGDFVFAVINCSLGTSHFSGFVFALFTLRHNFLLAFFYYLLIVGVFVAPLIFIQSSLGQFSSSGYISVFRIAPFFKGLGYVVFLINFAVLSYSAVFAAIPLFYTVQSLIGLSDIIECKNNTWNSFECKPYVYNETISQLKDKSDFYLSNDYISYRHLPSYEYYKAHFKTTAYWNQDEDVDSLSYNWILLMYALVVWLLIYHFNSRGIQWIGKANRYVTLSSVSIILMFIVKAFWTKGVLEALMASFESSIAKLSNHYQAFLIAPVLALQAFGKGWGTALVLGSYNEFRENVPIFSIAATLLHALLNISCSFITFIFFGFLQEVTFGTTSRLSHPLESVFIVFPSVLGSFGFPNFFLFLFFGNIVIMEVFGTLISFNALLVSFFDEHDNLRHLKDQITRGFVIFFILTTCVFCSRDGLDFITVLSTMTVLPQMLIFLFLILIVMWIYGRERLQRDIQFMVGYNFHTILVYMVRFVTPIFAILLFLSYLVGWTFVYIFDGLILEYFGSLLVKVAPFLIIPGYMIYSLKKPTGSILTRIRKLNRPTDWYPVEAEEKLKYESTLGVENTANPIICEDSEI